MKRRVTTFDTLVRSVKQFIRPAPSGPPYAFPLQIGDPMLRMRAEEVKLEEIKSEKIQRLLKNMRYVFYRSKSIGIAAPQVGVPLRIFMTELTEKESSLHTSGGREEQKEAPWPLKVFINPELEVCDNRTIARSEGCISFLGYTASVPRYAKIRVKGFSEEGEPVEWEASGLAARIVQHEIDHLNGTMYVDRMDCRTLEFCQWQTARNRKI